MSDKDTSADDEFEAGFASVTTSEQGDEPSSGKPSTDTAETADTGAQAEKAESRDGQADKPESAEPDPFASLPQAVRDLLADVPRMRVELERAHRQLGQIPALQSRIDRLTAPPRETAPPKLEKVDRLRTELPEIAEALDEMANALQPIRQAETSEGQQRQEPQQDTAASDLAVKANMDVLDESRPNWRGDLMSTDFQLWLRRQPAEYAREIQSTKKAGVILKSLGDFDRYVEQTKTARVASDSRATRMAAASTPRGDGRRSQAAASDEDAEFELGFRSVRGTR